jgi:hypothetical protein
MVPMVQEPVDAAFEAVAESKIGVTTTAWEPGQRALHERNRRLAAENARLKEENDTLREAAGMWIRLYERQLERANRATAGSDSTPGSRG